ncbi:MAG TPA: cupin domain-containing protein [Mycobacterium sp.]
MAQASGSLNRILGRGEEDFVTVQTGTPRLNLDDRQVDLKRGDSIYFAADVRHRCANPGATRCDCYVAAIIMLARSRRP